MFIASQYSFAQIAFTLELRAMAQPLSGTLLISGLRKRRNGKPFLSLKATVWKQHMPLLLTRPGPEEILRGQAASGSLAGTEFLAGALGPYCLPKPGLQHLSNSSTHYRTIHYGFWVCLAQT